MWLKTSSVSDRYGSLADIKIKQRYLLQSIDAPSGVYWKFTNSAKYAIISISLINLIPR